MSIIVIIIEKILFIRINVIIIEKILFNPLMPFFFSSSSMLSCKKQSTEENLKDKPEHVL